MEQHWKKNVTVFMASQALSILGSTLVQHAMTWYITLTTNSGFFTMLSVICGFVPALILSPIAGVWADRYNRKRLIIISDGCIALCTLLLAVSFLLGYEAIWLLFVAQGIGSLGAAVQSPCIGAMIPYLVPKNKLTRINGINGTMNALISVISPVLGAMLLGFISIELIFLIDVFTAAVAILVMAIYLRLPQKPNIGGNEESYLAGIKEGISYIAKHKYLRNFFVFLAIIFIFGGPPSFLTTLQVVRTFGDEVWMLSAIRVAFSSGMIAGGITISIWGGFKNRVYTMGFACSIMAVCIIFLGLPSDFSFYLFLMVTYGFAMSVFNTPANVLIQESVEPSMLGRVFSVNTMIVNAFFPLSMIIFGPLADVIPIEWLLIVTGSVILICSFIFMFKL